MGCISRGRGIAPSAPIALTLVLGLASPIARAIDPDIAFVRGPTSYTTLSYDEVLPAEDRAEILGALRKIPFDEPTLVKLPFLHYESGQGIAPRLAPSSPNRHAVERTHFFEGKRFDVWLTRLTNFADEIPMERRAFFGIAVDKDRLPKRAYFFSFKEEAVKARSLPELGGFVDSCFKCHANGPLVIRPNWSKRLPPLDEEGFSRMREWNRKIVAYGQVETFQPPPGSGFAPQAHAGWEPVRHRACVSCHDDSTSAPRSRLYRLQGEAMRALMDSAQSRSGYYFSAATEPHAIMPLGAPKLSPEERRCLDEWIDNDRGRAASAGCTPAGEVVMSRATTYVVDSSASSVSAEATSAWGKIPVALRMVFGQLRCADGRCSGEVRADLREARTGIDLRDGHLRESLGVTRAPFVTVMLPEFPLDAADTATVRPLRIGVDLSGHRRDYDTALRCARDGDTIRCRFERLVIRLAQHRIAVPAFLGVAVEDGVAASGEVTFRQLAETGVTAAGR